MGYNDIFRGRVHFNPDATRRRWTLETDDTRHYASLGELLSSYQFNPGEEKQLKEVRAASKRATVPIPPQTGRYSL